MRFHPAPVVFIYSFLASGDTWSNAAQYFRQAGYRANKLYVFDWNSIAGSGKNRTRAGTIQRHLVNRYA